MRGMHAVIIFMVTLVLFVLACGGIRGCHVQEANEGRRRELLLLTALGDSVAADEVGNDMPAIFEQMRFAFTDERYRATTVSLLIRMSDTRRYPVLEQFATDDEVRNFYQQLNSLPEADREQLMYLDSPHGESGYVGGRSLTEFLWLPRNASTARLFREIRAERPIPAVSTYFGMGWWWLWIYLIFCATFTIAFLCCLFMADVESDRIQWDDFGFRLVGYAIFPIPLTIKTFQFCWRLLRRLMNQQLHPIRRIASTFRYLQTVTAGWLYHLRILRRLPAPTVQPLASLGAVPSLPEQERPEDAEDTESENVPQWIAVEPQLLLGWRDCLRREEISVFPISLRQPLEVSMVAVQGADIARFEDALRLTSSYGVTHADCSTDIESTVMREYERQHGIIRLEGVDEDNKPSAQRVTEAVSASASGLDITFIKTREHLNGLFAGEKFAVVYGCSPDEFAPSVEQVFELGNQKTRTLDGFGPHQADAGTIIERNDVPLVQLMGNVAEVLFPLLSLGSAGEELLAQVLIEAAELWFQAELSDDQTKSDRWQSQLDVHSRNYIELRMKAVGKRRDDLVGEVKQCEETVREAEKIIVQAVRERHAKREELTRLETGEMDEERQRIHSEFQQMAASPSVLSVRATTDSVFVETRTVRIRYRGFTYEIGRFQIELRNDGGVRLKNVSNTANRSTSCDHPHVNGGGVACFGNISGAISKLMGRREYAAVVGLLFRFLESYNSSDPISVISHWKVVEDD